MSKREQISKALPLGRDGQADASAENTQNPGTQIDAVSGATISSTAVVTGINEAYEFLQSAK